MNHWDERYAGAGYYYGDQPNDFLRERAGAICRGGAVLCLGEGEGRNAVYLAEHGYAVVAMDQSAMGLGKARQLAADRGVEITTIHADLAAFPLEPARWDGIVSIWCHLPQPLRTRVYGQVVVALKPGGVFLLESYTPAQVRYGTGGPATVDLMATLQDLRRELAGLDFEVGVERERDVREGPRHGGLSAVVQVLARKPD